MKTMMRVSSLVGAFAALALGACAGSSHQAAATSAEPPPAPAAEASAMAADNGPRPVVEIAVFHDLRVDPDPVTLSKKGNHTAHWKLDGGGTLVVESKSAWPMNVECSGSECTGKIKVNGQDGRYEYRVIVDGKAGDPILIITP